MNRRPTSPKYRAARDTLLLLPGVFLPDYTAANVYRALERNGYAWRADVGRWVYVGDEGNKEAH